VQLNDDRREEGEDLAEIGEIVYDILGNIGQGRDGCMLGTGGKEVVRSQVFNKQSHPI